MGVSSSSLRRPGAAGWLREAGATATVAAHRAGALLALTLGGCGHATHGTSPDLDLSSTGFAQLAEPQLEGYATRSFGDASANRCAEDVVGGFEALPGAPSGALRYRSMGGRRLPPFNAKLGDFAGWEPHVQSIARLSLPWEDNLWAAVSRSSPGQQGGAGVFLIYLDGASGADGTRWVLPGQDLSGEPPPTRSSVLYYPLADTDHPGGMQAVGDYLVVASEAPEGEAPFVEIWQRASDAVAYAPLQRLSLWGDLGEPVAPTRFITATGMARLDSGQYLMFVLGKDEELQGWFYLSDPAPLSADTAWSFIGYVAMPAYYQNVNLITECDTQRIFLIATDNVGFDGAPDSGTEYADLMSIFWDAASESVQVPVVASRNFSAGGGGYCTFRAAANAFVDRDGQLELYCHAYKANTNLFGSADSKLKLVEYAP